MSLDAFPRDDVAPHDDVVTYDVPNGIASSDSLASDAPSADVPVYSDVLPDGEPTLVSGDVNGLAQLNHLQGDNPNGFQEDCGLVSIQDVLNQFGVGVTEADVVGHAVANGECDVTTDPSQSGGTSPDNQVQILSDYGISAHVETDSSLEQLAGDVQAGNPTIIGVNSGILWNDPNNVQSGAPDHAVVVTGVARDPSSGALQGFFINDSGTDQGGEFVDASTMTNGWLQAGGVALVTSHVAASPTSSATPILPGAAGGSP